MSRNWRFFDSSGLWRINTLDILKISRDLLTGGLHVISRLQVEPELSRSVECFGKPKRCIRGDAGCLSSNALNASARDAARLGEFACREFERDQKLFPENLTGMHSVKFLGHVFLHLQ